MKTAPGLGAVFVFTDWSYLSLLWNKETPFIKMDAIANAQMPSDVYGITSIKADQSSFPTH